MASTSSFFAPESPFISFANQATRGIFVALIKVTGINHRLTINEAIQVYFNHRYVLRKRIEFKLLLNNYLSGCYDEYLSIQQQIVNKTLNESHLNEDNMEYFVYCTIQKIMAQSNGYKHLNCILDGIMNYCYFQYDYLFAEILQDNIHISASVVNRGNFSSAEIQILRAVLDIKMNKINKQYLNLYLNDDKYQNIRFKCEENNSCELTIENAKRRFQEQTQLLEQEISNCPCTCDNDEH